MINAKMPRVGILYYGQSRLPKGYDFALSSVKEYCKRHGDDWTFDVYIHTWEPDAENICPASSAPFRIECDPSNLRHETVVGCIIEKPIAFVPGDWLHPTTVRRTGWNVSLPAAISQVYSIVRVCQSVKNPASYSAFILLRPDSVLDFWDLPLLDVVSSSSIHAVQDWVNLFEGSLIHSYCDILSFIKENPITDQWVDAESMRYALLRQMQVGIIGIWPRCSLIRVNFNAWAMIDAMPKHITDSYLSGYGVMHRQLLNGNILARFQPKSSPEFYQWIGISPTHKEFTVSFKARFLKCPAQGVTARWKTHHPDVVSPGWFSGLGETVQITSGTLTPANNPFIFLILDEILTESEVIVEVTDVVIKLVDKTLDV